MAPYTFPEVPTKTLGFLFIGLAVSLFVYGVTCAQTVRFYRLYPTERWYLKLTVFLLWVIETANIFVSTHAINYYTVAEAGNYLQQERLVWSVWVASATNSLSGTIVQIYYSRRLYIISNNRVVVVVICLLSILQLILSWLLAVVGIVRPQDIPRYVRTVSTGFLATAIVDILITVNLVYYLQIRKTGLARTQNIVNAIILHAVGCGALSSALSIGGLISYLTMKGSYMGFGFCFVLGKAYVNSMLSSLNARASLISTETRISLTDHVNLTITAGSSADAK